MQGQEVVVGPMEVNARVLEAEPEEAVEVTREIRLGHHEALARPGISPAHEVPEEEGEEEQKEEEVVAGRGNLAHGTPEPPPDEVEHRQGDHEAHDAGADHVTGGLAHEAHAREDVHVPQDEAEESEMEDHEEDPENRIAPAHLGQAKGVAHGGQEGVLRCRVDGQLVGRRRRPEDPREAQDHGRQAEGQGDVEARYVDEPGNPGQDKGQALGRSGGGSCGRRVHGRGRGGNRCRIHGPPYFFRLMNILMRPASCLISTTSWPVVLAQAGKSEMEPGSVVWTSTTWPTPILPISWLMRTTGIGQASPL